ncbi:MAG: hypothetical protein C4523_09445 [Myxococcales bacterium]|nr:MAG: hypothetical protein C4523_09445 [Myxococcales bacterium]
MAVFSLHVADTLAEYGSPPYYSEARARFVQDTFVSFIEIDAKEYATPLLVVSDFGAAFNSSIAGGGSASIGDDGLVTITASSTNWIPVLCTGSDAPVGNALWERLGFDLMQSFSYALAHTGTRQIQGSLFFGTLAEVGQDARESFGHQATGVRGHTAYVDFASAVERTIRAFYLDEARAEQIRRWYALAREGRKITLREGTSETYWALHPDMMTGVDSALRRTAHLYPLYGLELKLRQWNS